VLWSAYSGSAPVLGIQLYLAGDSNGRNRLSVGVEVAVSATASFIPSKMLHPDAAYALLFARSSLAEQSTPAASSMLQDIVDLSTNCPLGLNCAVTCCGVRLGAGDTLYVQGSATCEDPATSSVPSVSDLGTAVQPGADTVTYDLGFSSAAQVSQVRMRCVGWLLEVLVSTAGSTCRSVC
jgi:hypothetical protein